MEDEDFPTDEQVRLYTLQFMEMQASLLQDESNADLLGYAANGFMTEFMAKNPEIKEMRYLGNGKYEVVF